ncbi:MAG TPA: vitamin K epoxide reductase family protein [Longimicrobiales bacterium]|nr:vitamin K epoxide reductase family protein [Longimicrobiales bacterium]
MSARNRMAIAVLSLAGLFVALYLALHRIGLIGSLACGVDGGCSTVQTSPYATFVGVPVPFIGVLGYLVLFGVSYAAVVGRIRNERTTAVLLLVLAAVAFLFSVYLTALEAFVIHAWCRWCVVSAVIATLIFLFSLPEAARLRREVEP